MALDSDGAGACPSCGRQLDEHNRHVRFRLPDLLLGGPDGSDPELWMSGPDVTSSDLLAETDGGQFVRALLPVRLTGGYTMTFGVWLVVDPDVFERLVDRWWTSDYGRLAFDGLLANQLPGWDVLGDTASAQVKDPDQAPYVTGSQSPGLLSVMTRAWPHDDVLGRLP